MYGQQNVKIYIQMCLQTKSSRKEVSEEHYATNTHKLKINSERRALPKVSQIKYSATQALTGFLQ